MQIETPTNSASPAAARALDLDALAALDGAALARRYAEAPAPARLDGLDGHPRGRMLAVRGLDRGPLGAALRRLAGHAAFPWGGKSFSSTEKAAGAGVNRVHLFGRHALFPFHTRIAPSRVDGRPSVILDYDLPDNPSLIRAIHDEVREIEPGLWLGPAMWKGALGTTHVLWFALDAREQSRAVGE